MAFSQPAAFELLRRAQAQNRLAHAFLITGPAGAGKRLLARQLAALVTEQSPDDENALAHPDVHVVEPESKSRRIIIEQIRNLERELQMCSLRGAKKVGLIIDADRLVSAASNAFLKTLEEPPDNSLLLLVTAYPEALLDTIQSRCILLSLSAAGKPPLTAPQQRVLAAVQDFFRTGNRDLSRSFSVIGEFTELLREVKAGIVDETEEEWKKEEAIYRQSMSSDAAEARENFYKARSESRYLRERAGLVEVLLEWWADVLRHQHGSAGLDYPELAEATGALAARMSTPEILARIQELEGLRENFGRNVQEGLAVEVAFLKAFAN